MAPQPGVARFGVFEFNPSTGELWKQGTRVRLEPQPAKALACLLSHGGEVVSRETLKRTLWQDAVHVDFDRGLAYSIAQVRAALGDSAENPRFIETLPRRGFRFIAPMTADARPVATEPASAEVPAAMTSPVRSVPFGWRTRRTLGLATLIVIAIVITAVSIGLVGRRPVLAIAIFDNETGNGIFDSFTTGLSDALVIHLGAIDSSRIGVIGNARSLRMPRSERDLANIAADTGAQFILLGQLQPLEGQPGGFRLLTHIIRLDDGTHVWVRRFERADGSLSGLEPEVLAAAEQGVRAHVMGETSLSSPASVSR